MPGDVMREIDFMRKLRFHKDMFVNLLDFIIEKKEMKRDNG